jgi:hypothetical protein
MIHNSSSLSIFTNSIHSAILGDSIITVKVGPDQTNFHIHKRLLQLHSEYFTTALNGNWQEGDDGVVTLEDIEPKMCEC